MHSKNPFSSLPMKQRDLIDFREKCKVESNREELVRLGDSCRTQSSDLARDVAEVLFEEKCFECFKMMCEELRSVGIQR